MGLNAGHLRHRIQIQQCTLPQDSQSGDVAPPVWSVFADNVPARWTPLSVTEFIAAQTKESQIVARVVIRRMTGLKPDMRILYDGVYYDPAGFLADPDSGQEYLTIPVKQSLSQTE
jgi:SPP1 family predicted phage head-tail adaptor